MQVFVTGASGYIGLAVASQFARAGHRVVGLVRTPAKARSLALHEIEPLVGTLQEPGAWRERSAQCSVRVHCAMDYAGATYELDRAAIDALSTTRPGQRATLLYTSGVWVYGDTGTDSVDENSELHPPGLVRARVDSEARVLGRATGELATIVIRPGCLYGGSGSLTGHWFDSAATRGAARVVGDGMQRWAMVHLDDLADLYLRAGEAGLACEVFNATDRSRFRVRDCAEAASRAAGANGKVETLTAADAAKHMGPLAEPLGFTQHVDSSKAARLLGWQPRHAGFVDEVDRLHLAWRASREA